MPHGDGQLKSSVPGRACKLLSAPFNNEVGRFAGIVHAAANIIENSTIRNEIQAFPTFVSLRETETGPSPTVVRFCIPAILKLCRLASPLAQCLNWRSAGGGMDAAPGNGWQGAGLEFDESH